MSCAIEANELGRWYGQVVGLNELTVVLDDGVTGLVGPNGAGKSTFLKLIAGELKPSRGRITVLGQDPFRSRELYRHVGFCPQQDALYGAMTGREFVRFLMRLAGFSAREADERARRAMADLSMEPHMERRISTYSKGMRQRVKIAQAIAHDPELLVLDEPLTGLDPVGRHDVFALLRRLADQGARVLLSSHVLHEVEDLTQDILLLHRGRLLAQGTVRDVRRLLEKHPRRIELGARRPRDLACELMRFEGVLSTSVNGEEGKLTVETRDVDGFYRELTDVAARGGFGLRSLESLDEGLEAVFDYLVG